MKASQILSFVFLATSSVAASALPESNALDLLEAHGASVPRSELLSPEHALEKRKGGGGKGGGSGGGGSGGKSGGGSTGGGTGRTSTTSNLGGATKQGTGPSRSYGGGYYGGGASTPYAAGSKTPKGLIAAPLLLGGAALLIFPGLWLYNVYPYHYTNPYRFYNQSYTNRTQKRDGQNETLPVTCLCQEYSVCGCDENDDPAYLNDLVGNGSYAALNKTLVTVADVNGTKNLVLNGTLPNGTTAPGGTEDAEGAGANLLATMPFGRFTGYYVMGSIALYAVVLL